MTKKKSAKEKAAKKKKVKSKRRLRSIPSEAEQSTAGVSQDQSKLNITPHPKAGPQISNFEQQLDDQLGGGAEQAGKKRGRPKKLPEPEPEITDVPVEFVEGAVKLPFELWAISQGVPDLSLSDAEARQLSQPVKQLLDYYLPIIPPAAYAWGSLAVTSFWLMRPRLLLLQKIRADGQPEQEAKPAARRPPQPPPKNPNEVKRNNFPGADEIKITEL